MHAGAKQNRRAAQHIICIGVNASFSNDLNVTLETPLAIQGASFDRHRHVFCLHSKRMINDQKFLLSSDHIRCCSRKCTTKHLSVEMSGLATVEDAPTSLSSSTSSSSSSSSTSTASQDHLQAKKLEMKRWFCVWPTYIDAGKTVAEGRKIPKGLCVKQPNFQELLQACQKLGLKALPERKGYPRDFMDAIRVRVQLKNDAQQPVVATIHTKHALLVALAAQIVSMENRVAPKQIEFFASAPSPAAAKAAATNAAASTSTSSTSKTAAASTTSKNTKGGKKK